jgi:DnaJ-class molecular chaperone
MATNNTHTPDRDINPPDDHSKRCEDCKGEGRILIQSDDDDEDFEPGFETEKCTTCEGEGWVPIDDHDDDW